MILVGDAIERLRELDAGSVQTCITSPPYFGLRDYGTGQWSGGDEGCEHRQERPVQADATSTLGVPANGGPRRIGEANATVVSKGVYRDLCGKCGARRVDRQLGLESTPDEYVARLVDVFREVRRVLRDDGTVWLNLGDSYMARQFGWGNTNDRSWAAYHREAGDDREKADRVGHPMEGSHAMARATGLKPKDLVGIPWRVAFALQADGWWLRSDIVWAKPNPMPESVTDRPTRAHEYVFLLAKSAHYFWDADAVREAHADSNTSRLEALRKHGDVVGEWVPGSAQEDDPHRSQLDHRGLPGVGTTFGKFNGAGRNKRSVWTVATQPFPGAHFAVFPPKLIEPCVLAGSPPKCCGECGAPWVRLTESEIVATRERTRNVGGRTDGYTTASGPGAGFYSNKTTTGWCSACACSKITIDRLPNDPLHAAPDVARTASSVVLDPFAGSGTVGVVCRWHGRDFIGIELNPEYAAMAERRIQVEGSRTARAARAARQAASAARKRVAQTGQLDLLQGGGTAP